MSQADIPLTAEQVALVAKDLKLAPDTILCSIDVPLAIGAVKRGRGGDAAVDYLRWVDLQIENRDGRIERDDLDRQTIHKGQGISFFIKKVLPKGLCHVDSGKLTKGRKKALKEHYKKIRQADWWKLENGTTFPAGLVLIYDGDPPGHCTLSPDREMTVGQFLGLVEQLEFSHCGRDILGAKK